MNSTIKDFSAPIKTVFCSFSNLSSRACDSICHHPCPIQLWYSSCWQVRTRALAMEGQSWRGQAHLPDPGQPSGTRSTRQSLSRSHTVGCFVSHQPDNWLYWEPVLQGPWQHRNSKTGEQVTSEEVLVVAAVVSLFPAVTRAGCGVRPGGCKSPLQTAPGAAPVGGAASSHPWPCSRSFHISKAGRGVPDGMCLAACRAAPVWDEPQQKAAGCSVARDMWGHPERESAHSAFPFLQEVFHLRNCRIFSPGLLPRWGEADGSFHSRDAFCSLVEKTLCEGDPLVTALVMLSCTGWAVLPNTAPARSSTIPSARLAARGWWGCKGKAQRAQAASHIMSFPSCRGRRNMNCDRLYPTPAETLKDSTCKRRGQKPVNPLFQYENSS